MILAWIIYLVLIFWLCFTVGFCLSQKINEYARCFRKIPKWQEALGFFWSIPNTMIGIFMLFLAGGPVVKERYGLLRFRFQPRSWWYFPNEYIGMSWGCINLFRKIPAPDRVLIHEDEHSRQALILGPFQLIFYPLFSFLAALLYGKSYKANWLEMGARDVTGEKVDCIEDMKK